MVGVDEEGVRRKFVGVGRASEILPVDIGVTQATAHTPRGGRGSEERPRVSR